MKKSYVHFVLTFVIFVLLAGCAKNFRALEMDTKTGDFKSWRSVQQKDIKQYNLMPNVKNLKFVYLRASYTYDDMKLYNYLKTALNKIGIDNILNETDLSNFVLSNNLSNVVTSVTDPIALHKLSAVFGPFICIDATLDMILDCTYKFEIKIVDPTANQTLLEVSRVEVNTLDMDNEINRPMLNLLKKWYDESAKLENPSNRLRPESSSAGI